MQIKFPLIFGIEKHDGGNERYVEMGEDNRFPHWWEFPGYQYSNQKHLFLCYNVFYCLFCVLEVKNSSSVLNYYLSRQQTHRQTTAEVQPCIIKNRLPYVEIEERDGWHGKPELCGFSVLWQILKVGFFYISLGYKVKI